MSIWEKCEEHKAVPFFGFPMVPSFGSGILKFKFPEGYVPNGSQTQEVAEQLAKFVGGEIITVTDNLVEVKASDDYITSIIYNKFMSSNAMYSK